MKRFLGAAALLVMLATIVRSQPALRVVTHPKVPTRDVLDRLGLSVAWHAKLPTGGLRDGLFTLQLLPAKNRTQLVVQSIFGTVTMLDAETGDALWRTPVGIPNWNGQPVGYNEQNLFVTRRNLLFVLDRANGGQRYYTLNKDTKLPDYGFNLPGAPTAAPRADEDMIFLPMGSRVEAYVLPDFDVAKAIAKPPLDRELTAAQRQALLEKTDALPPLLVWSFRDAGARIDQPVLLTPNYVTAVTSAGAILSLKKLERSEPYEFQTNGTVTAPMGQHGVMAYIGSEDYTLYAFDITGHRLAWRFLASAPILVQPEVTDRDVFVSAHRKGLYRLERATGRAAWLNERADRFLSTNQKFVYALDRTGVLLVLDYARGTTLGQFDMRDWLLPAPNELTDRFYLASHDGQILCLRNKAEKAPLKNKTFEVKLAPKVDEKKVEP